MDRERINTEMLGSERGVGVSDILITHGPWRVRELQLIPGKAKWLWEEMQKQKSLFSDFTRGNVELFIDLLEDPYSFWLEVIDENDSTIGIMYLTELNQVTDANIHLMFLDRKASEKAELVKEMVELVFKRFSSLNRITASFPEIYHATIRLARRAGFVEEGRKRQVTIMGGKPQDEMIFGILAQEALRGSNS